VTGVQSEEPLHEESTDVAGKDDFVQFSPVDTASATAPINGTNVEKDVGREFDPTPFTSNSVDAEPFASLNLSLEVLEHLLNEARFMQPRFPFIIIESSWTVSSMIVERPALLLAAVTNASSKYPRLQKSLASTLQETFAQRVVITGDRNIDLLQAMLLHLAWYVLTI
jgi:hypothetical protein